MHRALAAMLLSLTLIACGDKDDDSAGATGACASLCTDAGFDGGEEVDYGDNLIECTCSGSGGEVTASACADDCDPYGVSAENALLSSENGPNDKCVCDGTSG